MSRAEEAEAWVVYQMPIRSKPGHLTAVCEQAEWDVMELRRPGHYTLVREGITNEGEAESLARSNAVPAPVGFVIPLR
jgi:hypothetical protein